MKILPVLNLQNNVLYRTKYNNKDNFNNENNYVSNPNLNSIPHYKDFPISFGMQVDKSMNRFYEVNKDRMPITVKNYIDSLDDKSEVNPIEAQREAFEKLNYAESIDDVKKSFPNEKLFDSLIDFNQTKARRGILLLAKEDEDILKMSNQGILKDKSNLTVYLLKKIFLEAKTLDEINEDLKFDLNPDLKAELDSITKGTKNKYVYPSTLKALGIKTPVFEYQQSLRYTREGYSDRVAQSISTSLTNFWQTLSVEDRNARARKSVIKFEKWWESLSKNQKLNMIADQIDAISMQEMYKKSASSIEKDAIKPKTSNSISEHSKTNHVHVGSDKLSNDDLFKKWATNNLKVFEASLSEEDKDSIALIRARKMAERWATMSPAEKTEYISKMKAGSEPIRFAMIDAWNNSPEIIKDLSEHLKESQILKPANLLYSTDEFANFQSLVMTEFWKQHPEHAIKLGENIKKSIEKVEFAIANGKFIALQNEISRNKSNRLKEIERLKSLKLQNAKNMQSSISDKENLVIRFKNAYLKSQAEVASLLPKEYLDAYFLSINELPNDLAELWIEYMENNQQMSPIKLNKLNAITKIEPESVAKIDRSLEAAGANILYDITQNPEVFNMSHSDIKRALYQVKNHQDKISIISHNRNREFIIDVKNHKINMKKFNELFHYYNEPIEDKELDAIIDKYFKIGDLGGFSDIIKNSPVSISVNGFNRNGLKQYLNNYGKSLYIIFSDKSAYPPEVKREFYNKLISAAPDFVSQSFDYCVYNKPNAFYIERNLKSFRKAFQKRYDFVPELFMEKYSSNLIKDFDANINSPDTIIELENMIAKKRKSAAEYSQIVHMDKQLIKTEDKLFLLVIEQALADVLYEATGDVNAYAMEFEELCDNIEVFKLAKKFPTDVRTYMSKSLDTIVNIKANKRINIYSIRKLAEEYLENMIDKVNSSINNPLSKEDFLFILSPYDCEKTKDSAILRRIAKYNFRLK